MTTDRQKIKTIQKLFNMKLYFMEYFTNRVCCMQCLALIQTELDLSIYRRIHVASVILLEIKKQLNFRVLMIT